MKRFIKKHFRNMIVACILLVLIGLNGANHIASANSGTTNDKSMVTNTWSYTENGVTFTSIQMNDVVPGIVDPDHTIFHQTCTNGYVMVSYTLPPINKRTTEDWFNDSIYYEICNNMSSGSEQTSPSTIYGHTSYGPVTSDGGGGGKQLAWMDGHPYLIGI